MAEAGSHPLNVLAVASEIHPLVKTGGLADVVGALPSALAAQGVETRTLVPGYPAIRALIAKAAKPLAELPDIMGEKARIHALDHAGLRLLVLDAPAFFDRPGGPYSDASGRDWTDNWRRFAGLSRAAAMVAGGALPDWRPDLVHCHDWQAGLTPAYLAFAEGRRVPSVATVHNIAFQGQFSRFVFGELGLPNSAYAIDGLEYYGGVGFLKAAFHYADAVTTVSPAYAEEIRSPRFGMGLEGMARSRGASLSGILNGIDVAEWNPETDPHLASRFSARTLSARNLSARSGNRRAIEKRFGLDEGTGPLFAVVTRLTWQKGMDLLADAVDDLVAAGGSLALLGSGDGALEDAFRLAAERHPGRVGTIIGYDEGVSHLIQGGADAILVPSRFEPCGLTQLYGLRYGCVPVVARTGGLADTVIDANEAAVSAGVATGIAFAPDDPAALRHAIGRTVALHGERDIWQKLQKNGMKADNSWEASATRYADLYRSLVSQKRRTP